MTGIISSLKLCKKLSAQAKKDGCTEIRFHGEIGWSIETEDHVKNHQKLRDSAVFFRLTVCAVNVLWPQYEFKMNSYLSARASKIRLYFERNNITHFGKFTCDYETGYVDNEVSVEHRRNTTSTGDSSCGSTSCDQFNWHPEKANPYEPTAQQLLLFSLYRQLYIRDQSILPVGFGRTRQASKEMSPPCCRGLADTKHFSGHSTRTCAESSNIPSAQSTCFSLICGITKPFESLTSFELSMEADADFTLTGEYHKQLVHLTNLTHLELCDSKSPCFF
ncbi:hypothetical protein KCU65_g467, partial [Aureobasidium melanogenum]